MTGEADRLVWHRLDPSDGRLVIEWLTLSAEAADADASVPGTVPAAPPCPTDLIGSLRFAPPDTELDDWVVRHRGRVVGALRLALPASAPVARVDQLLVHPSLRRRGIGRLLHDRALERARRHGRTVLTTTIPAALPDGPAAPEAPAAFAAALGAAPAPGGAGMHQWLDLARHDPLADGVPGLPAGYRLVSWGTVTPDEYAVAVSWLEHSLGGDDAEEPDVDIATSYARRFERMRIGRGRRAYHTGVLHEEDERLVGYTSISKTTGNPEHALQGMTVVHTAHRRHGLGRIIKLANLAQALRHEPRLRLVETANAEDNTAMLAVNAAMGFRPHARWVGWSQGADRPRT